jgi:hypothetical protein
MAILDDVLKGGSFPLVGLGIVALAVPYFIPALRPQFAAVLKSGAKLFLEAELGADDAIVDRYVGAAIDALVQATAHGTEEERKAKAESQVNRFVSRAQAGARRRGWDEQDAERRYRRRLAKLDHALERARHRAKPGQHAALVHASDTLTRHRSKAKPSGAPPAVAQRQAPAQPVPKSNKPTSERRKA